MRMYILGLLDDWDSGSILSRCHAILMGHLYIQYRHNRTVAECIVL